MAEKHGYVLEIPGRKERFFAIGRKAPGDVLSRTIEAGNRAVARKKDKRFSITDSISARTQEYRGNPHGTARDIPSHWTPARVKRLPGGRIQVRIGGQG